MIASTLVRPVTRAGPALHSGRPAVCTLAPGGPGITFHTPSGPVPATLPHARATPGATVLEAGAAWVATPEHLLAALAALGVWDCAVHLDGDELPALDGAAADWVAAVDEAGRRPTREVDPRSPRGRVEAHGGAAELVEGDAVGVVVDFPGGPRGALEVPATEAAFRAEIAWARTFVLARDVPALRAAGRGRGATPENTVVWPDAPLRSPDEPVRHKLLDAWGDLALLGPVRAAFRVSRGSHALHLAALRAACASSS